MEDRVKQEYLELENKQLYWGRDFDYSEIRLRQFKYLVKKVVRLILSAFIIYGFISFIYYLVINVRTGISLFNLGLYQSYYLVKFYFSVIALLYLIYNLGLDNKKYFNVIRRSFDNIKAKKNLKRVDISDSFTLEALRLIDRAYLKALKNNHDFNSLYLLNTLFNSKVINIVFSRLGVSTRDLKNVTSRVISNFAPSKSSVHEIINKILYDAYYLAYRESRSNVEVTDLLEATINNDKIVQDILLDIKITPDAVSNVIKWANMQKMLSARYKRYRAKSYFRPKGTMDRAMTAMATPVLDSFSEDLTALAKSGYLPICVAREKEFTEIFHIIEGGRNSVVLVGLPGVGKSNIIEGLANRMVAEEVPKVLQDKRLVSLSIAHLVAGATRPNELGERVLIIIKEVQRADNIILHIDNIHDLVGVSSQGSENVDLAEIFSKFLSSKSILVVATTYPAEYKTYLEGSPLGQILQKINVLEPEDNEAIQMIESKVGSIENKNNIYFSYNSIEKAVKLSRRYVPDYYLPDKAIRVLEEVVEVVKGEKVKRNMVSGEDIARVISSHTNIPLTEITQEESEKLLNLEAKIHQRMVDQNEAVDFVSSALRRARTELRDIGRPIVNLLFLGPTGVGKTELAKTVAQIYFGSEDKMVRLDMSEYQNKESLNKLIGGSGETGYLTESIRKNPFSLLLLDEIEKAHVDILNIFLQVMDDGRLTDGKGRTVDFTNCILIATSNAGTQFIQDNIQAGENIGKIKELLINNELKQYFKPEFLNRFDGIVVFKPLSPEDIAEITVLLLNKVKKRLIAKGIYLEVSDEATKEIAEAGFNPVFGARPLRRVIQERVDNALANYLLKGRIGRRDKVILEKGGELRVEKATRF